MAAILSVSAANADTTKRIASTNYVDNKVDNQHNGQVITATDTTGVIGYKQIDSAVTQGSSNLVTSGAVQTAIANSQNATTYTAGDGLDLNNNEFTANVGDGLAINATSKAIELDAATQASLALADTALQQHQDISGKQDNLGGGANDGKVVTATGTAGSVTYTGIDTTVGANANNLVTSGAVQTAISNAQNATTYTAGDGLSLDGNEFNAEVGTGLAINGSGAIELDSATQASLALADTALQQHQDISGKQDKIANATANDITITDANGQTQDSGKAFTTTVSASSTDAQIPTALAVQTAISGAVDTAIDGVTYPTVNITGNNALANIDGTAAANQDTHCSANEPCVLTYEGNGAYKWSSIWGLPTNN